MVENLYMHSPVADKDGLVVALFDIGKCLNNAISDSNAEKM